MNWIEFGIFTLWPCYLTVLPKETSHWNPWKSKTKQRMVFRMIHIKDSLLPMGKVWSLDLLGNHKMDVPFSSRSRSPNVKDFWGQFGYGSTIPILNFIQFYPIFGVPLVPHVDRPHPFLTLSPRSQLTRIKIRNKKTTTHFLGGPKRVRKEMVVQDQLKTAITTSNPSFFPWIFFSPEKMVFP